MSRDLPPRTESSKAVRFAPARHGRPAATFWKFWASGNEVYALTRGWGDLTRVSVHSSGQIHMHMGGRDIQTLAMPLPLAGRKWLHAFELRFLLSADAHFPPPERQKKGKNALVIDVPEGAMLIANLIIGQAPENPPTTLPPEFFSHQEPLWRTNLADGRPVALVLRMLDLDQHNKDQITLIRQTLNPRANLSGPPSKPPYVEVRNIHWSQNGGNIVLVVPMGNEAYRVLPAPGDTPLPLEADRRRLRVEAPSASFPVTAPNGAVVGMISFSGSKSEVMLPKDAWVTCSLGSVKLSMIPSSLCFGQIFQRPRLVSLGVV